MTTLIIARHGNTFLPDQIPTRVGVKTNMALVQSGEDQALRLGHHLKARRLIPDFVFTSTLHRTIDTARLACVSMGCSVLSRQLTFLDEIDYGVDENRPEPEVIARHGDLALKRWDEFGEMPDGWLPRPDTLIESWKFFLGGCEKDCKGKIVLVVTSNGVARFALSHVENARNYPLKLATGAYGILKYEHQKWSAAEWNIRP